MNTWDICVQTLKEKLDAGKIWRRGQLPGSEARLTHLSKI